MKIVIDYSDGMYGIRAEDYDESIRSRPDAIEVPDEQVALWRAIWKAATVVQDQLRDLDNKAAEEEQHFTKESARKIRWKTES